MRQREMMKNEESENSPAVQSTATLLKASLFAAVFGLLVLILVILPAEYNIDPTGLGQYMGLVQLSNPQSVQIVDETQSSKTVVKGEYHEDNVDIIIPAGVGLEYKYNAQQGESVRYTWTSDRELFFDFHGEPKGDTTGYFQSYTVSTSNNMRGSLTAPFEGTHGWYWENKTASPINVKLHIEGNYELIGIKK